MVEAKGIQYLKQKVAAEESSLTGALKARDQDHESRNVKGLQMI